MILSFLRTTQGYTIHENVEYLFKYLLWKLICGFCFSLKWGHMRVMTYQLIGHPTICSTVCLGWYQRKHQSRRYRPFVKGIQRWPVDSPHKGSVMRKAPSSHEPYVSIAWPNRGQATTWTNGVLTLRRIHAVPGLGNSVPCKCHCE